MMQGSISTYECYKYITVRKNSSQNELFLWIWIPFMNNFESTSVKQNETHGLKHVTEEY